MQENPDPCNLDKMRGNGIADSVSTKFEEMVGNDMFRKIRDYSNVSKHHYAIKGDVHVEFGESCRHTEYFTKKFDFKSRSAQHMSASELRDYVSFVGKYVDDIGALLNRELYSRVVSSK